MLSHLQQDVREHSGPLNAYSNTQSITQVWCVQQRILQALAPTRTHEISHRRKTLWMC